MRVRNSCTSRDTGAMYKYAVWRIRSHTDNIKIRHMAYTVVKELKCTGQETDNDLHVYSYVA